MRMKCRILVCPLVLYLEVYSYIFGLLVEFLQLLSNISDVLLFEPDVTENRSLTNLSSFKSL